MVDILDIYRVVCGHCTEAAPQTNFVSKLVYQEAAAGDSLGQAAHVHGTSSPICIITMIICRHTNFPNFFVAAQCLESDRKTAPI